MPRLFIFALLCWVWFFGLFATICQARPSSVASFRLAGKQSEAVRLTETNRSAGNPTIAWTGEHFIVAWNDNRTEVGLVYFTIVDENGNKLLDDTLVSEHDDTFPSHSATILLEQKGFRITYFHKERVFSTSFSASGERLYSSNIFFSSIDMLSCRIRAFAGSIALSWTDLSDKRTMLNFGLLPPGSETLAEQDQIALSGGTTWVSASSLAVAGGRAGVAWTDNPGGLYQIYFRSFDKNGLTSTATVQVSNSTEKAFSPFLRSAGDHFAVAWFDERDGNPEIYFSSFANEIPAEEVRVTKEAAGSYNPVLAWADGFWGLTWYDYRDGNSEIYFKRLSADGQPIGDTRRLTSDDEASHSPALVWAEDKFGLVWLDEQLDDNLEVYFMTLFP